MFKNIQMLRAVAAFMVFCFHAAPQYQVMGGMWKGFERVAGVGFAGVDIFFVISGFVAALTTLNKDRTIANACEFLKRRVLRIYLGYWPFFGLALVTFALSGGYKLSQSNLVGSFFLTSVEMPRLVLYVSWSLTYELVFYLLVAATFVTSASTVIRCVHLATAMLASFLYFKLGDPLSPTFIFLAFFLEFLSGVLLYIHREALRGRWWILPCAAIACAAYWMGFTKMATDGAIRIFTFGTAAFFLVMLAVILEQSRVWIASRFWVGLGDASYTLYLVHLILLVLFASCVRNTFAAQTWFLRELGFLGFLVFGVWLSRMLYLRLELPLYLWALGVLKGRFGH